MAAVVVVAVTRVATGQPTTDSFALTPDRLGEGKIWLFVSSALIANGPPLPQIAWLIPTVAVAQRRLGAGVTSALMAAAHVGATLLAYGGLQLFTGDADGAHNRELDYGISAVWLGLLGAIWATAVPAARRRAPIAVTLIALGLAALAASIALFPLLAATEHGLAFALGASVVALRNRAEPLVARLDPAQPGSANQLGRP